ncbi:hypothetical protein P3X46_032285 [Hevea brasiliensis]|uniref:Uncharacterized protein n=1 Tax=Hevea brasiliensis TaxID=3981 RepID=A0ABQ9KFV6_HEVBR|nr:hypothetical protein P3X46_032285 [Hevea brasiliensis]
MVQVKAIFTVFVLCCFLVFTSAIRIHSGPVVAGRNQAKQSHQITWQRMNHGSFRGPRKHIVNPSIKHPFQVPQMPV